MARRGACFARGAPGFGFRGLAAAEDMEQVGGAVNDCDEHVADSAQRSGAHGCFLSACLTGLVRLDF